ncbi:MAG: Lrp/AsnC family transcriptional regulator [Sphingobium sp.]|jgi:DNA-binding Lrp family transcriptional regulator|nr:Lrp/AsnC family transcriptional regulator [Sphingobium sp.]MCI1271722.1 Lrp/AsnC family transcriptional regulator [Sphingobium sp.]MCI1756123.1 Lrp/AsnC family transcriptional regulator [Sphingobium sp.]MCI2053554.1 Lrp/AsnC family transcriptional regulator [Sphingobium sp.]
MKEISLDTLDRKLLRVLQRRADISQLALSEEVGASPASCWRRLRSLEDAGVLGPVVRLLNPQAVGKKLDIVCQVRMKVHDLESRASFEAFIARRDEVMECLSMSGEWDYQLRLTLTDMAEYEDFLMRHLLAHPTVANSASHFALKRIKYTTALSV